MNTRMTQALQECKRKSGSYYDKVLLSCVPCEDVCGQHPSQCNDHCQALQECKSKFGSFYDKVLLSCVPCEDICGQHPSQCNDHCQAKSWAHPGKDKMQMPFNHMLLIYFGVAIVIITVIGIIIFILWRIMRKPEQPLPCKPSTKGRNKGSLPKDHIIESRLAIETPSRNRKLTACRNMRILLSGGITHRRVCKTSHTLSQAHTATSVPSALYNKLNKETLPPVEENNRSFKIICSPAQERSFIDLTGSLSLSV